MMPTATWRGLLYTNLDMHLIEDDVHVYVDSNGETDRAIEINESLEFRNILKSILGVVGEAKT